MGLLRRLIEDLTSTESEYGTPSITLTGEHVRSKAEQKVADYLTSQGVSYQYEKTAKTDGLILKEKISKPDFYLRDHGIYVEYWGLLSADDKGTRKGYKRTMKWKMAQYRKNKIKFISLYPDNLDNLDWIFRTRFREVAGFDLPKRMGLLTFRYCVKCGKPLKADSRFCGNCGLRIAA
jgi:hypothetical protein